MKLKRTLLLVGVATVAISGCDSLPSSASYDASRDSVARSSVSAEGPTVSFSGGGEGLTQKSGKMLPSDRCCRMPEGSISVNFVS